jgi:threonine aldolase
MHFASDNTGPVHPKVMEALARANDGYAMPYGNDALSRRCGPHPRGLRGAGGRRPSRRHGNGGQFAHPRHHGPALVHDLLRPPRPYQRGRMQRARVLFGRGEADARGRRRTRRSDPTRSPPPSRRRRRGASTGRSGARCRSPRRPRRARLRARRDPAIAGVARRHGLKVHMDGARFTNALVRLGCSPAEMTWKAGVDAVSFGGTKNGLMGVEAAVIFDPATAWEFELRRKRGAHLFSKHRYLAAQMGPISTATSGSRWPPRPTPPATGWPGASSRSPARALPLRAAAPTSSSPNGAAPDTGACTTAGAEYYLWSGTLDGGPGRAR